MSSEFRGSIPICRLFFKVKSNKNSNHCCYINPWFFLGFNGLTLERPCFTPYSYRSSYHLVMTNIANWKINIFKFGTSSINGPFPMAMLNNQMTRWYIFLLDIPVASPLLPPLRTDGLGASRPGASAAAAWPAASLGSVPGQTKIWKVCWSRLIWNRIHGYSIPLQIGFIFYITI